MAPRSRTIPNPRKSSARRAAVSAGFRSAFELSVDAQLRAAGVTYQYEKRRIAYVPSGKPRHYRPDYELGNGIIIECKGLFSAADRTKHLLVRNQHPELDIRFVFQRSTTRLSKTSKTTYADWCRKNGFQYADKLIPASWLTEEQEC